MQGFAQLRARAIPNIINNNNNHIVASQYQPPQHQQQLQPQLQFQYYQQQQQQFRHMPQMPQLIRSKHDRSMDAIRNAPMVASLNSHQPQQQAQMMNRSY